MKYFHFILFLILSVFSCAVAQENTDSIYFYRQSSIANEFNRVNITNLNGDISQKSGMAKLLYQYKNGHFRKAQEAEKDQKAGLYSEGINTIGRFKVAGSFSFARIYQDSLSWSAKGPEFDSQAYYFGSQKAGKFERLDYQLKGILSYSLIKNKLHVGLGTDYNYRSSTRSIDPRPRVDNFSLIFKPEMAYQTGTHYIGIQGNIGYGIEDFALTYKTKAFENGTFYKDRINYLIFGYGAIKESASDQKTVRNDTYKGIALNYSGSLDKYKLQAKLSYDHAEDRFKEVSTISVNDILIGTYWLETLKAELLFTKNSAKTNQQISVNLKSTSGKDKNETYQAVNYYYKDFIAEAEYLIRLAANKNISPEFGFNFLHNNTEHKVLITDHNIITATNQLGVIGNLYIKIPKNELLSFGANLSHIFPSKSELSVPTLQENNFTRGVVYGDYMYLTSKAMLAEGRMTYISSHIFKDFKTGLSIGVSYLKQTTSKFIFENSSFTPDKHRFSMNLSLNLYF